MTQKVGGVEFDVVVDDSSVTNAATKIPAELDKVENAFNEVDSASKKASKGMVSSAKTASNGMRNMRHAAGQLGFQVQDMAVQLQAGTNAMVVLGQQGSQVASIFGPTGAMVGAVIAVGAALAGVLIPSIMDSGKETENLTEKLKELQKESQLTAAQTAYLEQEQQKETKAKKERIAEIDKEIKAIESASISGGNYSSIIAIASGANKDFGNAIKSVLPSVTAQAEELKKLRAERDLLEGKTGGKVFDEDANKKAIMSYANRVVAIQAALDQESTIVLNNLKYRAAVEDGIFTEQEAAIRQRRENSIANERAAFANKIELLNQQRVSILESEAITETQRQNMLSQFRVMESDAAFTHQQKLVKIEKDAADARAKIAEQERQTKLNALSSTFRNLSSLMNTESRKLFEIGKAGAVASAVVDGYKAVAKTMAEVPYPFNIPLAAAQAVASAAQVKGIMSTNFGDAGGGQVYSGGQVATPTTQQQPQQRNISISLAGSNFSGGDVRSLIEEINNQLGDGVSLGVAGG